MHNWGDEILPDFAEWVASWSHEEDDDLDPDEETDFAREDAIAKQPWLLEGGAGY